MTPEGIKSVISALQERLRRLEEAVRQQTSANVIYYDVDHELIEASEALDRATELLDKIGVRAS